MRLFFINSTLRVVSGSQSMSIAPVSQEQADYLMSKADSLTLEQIEQYLDMHKPITRLTTKLAGVGIENRNGAFYWGTPISMPPVLVDEVQSYLDQNKDISPLKNFWLWAQLNPNPVSRTSLYDFVKHNNLKLTQNGMIVTYRNMKFKCFESLEELVKYLTRAINMVQANPYQWMDINGQKVQPGDFIAKPERYLDIEMTDQHTRTMSYRIGVPASISRSECDPNPENTCSRGLHVGSQEFLSNGYYGDGGISIRCLVNPMHVVACAKNEFGKLRVCEFLPIQFVTNDDRPNDPIIENNAEDYGVLAMDSLNELYSYTDDEEYREYSLEQFVREVIVRDPDVQPGKTWYSTIA